MRYNRISDVQVLHEEAAFIESAVSLLQQASRHVRIRSALLDPVLFDTPAFNDALSAFARKSRYSQVMVLIDYPNIILQRGHRTLELMRRLSDKITFRHYFDEADEQRDSWLLTDYQGVLIKPVAAEANGYCSLTDKIQTKRLADTFDYEWERSPLARQLRQLSI